VVADEGVKRKPAQQLAAAVHLLLGKIAPMQVGHEVTGPPLAACSTARVHAKIRSDELISEKTLVVTLHYPLFTGLAIL
jgi:hypothetical protein